MTGTRSTSRHSKADENARAAKGQIVELWPLTTWVVLHLVGIGNRNRFILAYGYSVQGQGATL